MATIAQTVRTRDAAGIRARRVLDITGPSSYATGGDPITAGILILGTIEHFPDCIAINAALDTVRLVHFNPTTSTLSWIVPNTGNEVADATDLSGYTFRVEVVGKG